MTSQAVREPPILTDKQVYAYLQEMARQINFALQQVDAMISPESPSSLAKQLKNDAQIEITGRAEALKSLIIKNAYEVKHQIENLEQSLSETYIAVSDWGTYKENLSSDITATAQSVVQGYNFQSQIDSLENYNTNSQQYIKTGLLYYETVDGQSVPRYGVAVGEELTTVTVTVEEEVVDEQGNTQTVQVDKEVLSRTKLCSTFTSDRLSFWQGAAEVAYISNNRLHISNADISGVMRIGDWEISHADGFTIRYVG